MRTFDTSATIGLVGLGIMGTPTALRWRDKGYKVVAWNLEPERYDEVSEAGVEWAKSPRDVFAASDVAFVCVLGDEALESVTMGEQGFVHAAEGASVLVDLSTSSPAKTLELAPRFKQETGAAWVDAPMSGGPQAARDGELTLMIGGEKAVCDSVMPLLEAIAANVTHMGDPGAGQKTKILNQAIVGVNYLLMAELLTIAEKSEVDPELLPGCLQGGMADSTILQRIFPQMSRRDFDPPRSSVKQVYKDLKAVRAFVDELGLDLPVISKAIELYGSYAPGHEKEDGASVSRLYVR